MAGINKVILVGNLGRDPEIRYAPSGTAVAKFSLATTERYNNEERTEWHRIVAFGRLAEICGEYLSKGKQIYIEGRLQTNEWEDRDGNKRYTTEIIANTMQMLGQRGDSPQGPREPSGQQRGYRNEGGQRGGPAPARNGGGNDGPGGTSNDDGWGGPPGDDEIPF